MKNFLTVDKDDSVYYEVNAVKESKVALLIIHGMCEHHGRYDGFMKELGQNGISTIGIDLRGHGLSSGRRGDIQSIEKCVEDVRRIAEIVRKEFGFQKLGVFGHSMGGEISLIACGKHPKLFDFCVLSNPVIYLPQKVRFLKFVPFRNNPLISVKKRVSESPQMLKKSLNDPLAANVFNLRTANQIFFKGVKILEDVKEFITCPLLLCRGGSDRLLTNGDKFNEFFASLKTKKKKMLFYERANHRLVQNADSGRHIEDIIEWIKTITKMV